MAHTIFEIELKDPAELLKSIAHIDENTTFEELKVLAQEHLENCSKVLTDYDNFSQSNQFTSESGIWVLQKLEHFDTYFAGVRGVLEVLIDTMASEGHLVGEEDFKEKYGRKPTQDDRKAMSTKYAASPSGMKEALLGRIYGCKSRIKLFQDSKYSSNKF